MIVRKLSGLCAESEICYGRELDATNLEAGRPFGSFLVLKLELQGCILEVCQTSSGWYVGISKSSGLAVSADRGLSATLESRTYRTAS